MVSLGVIISFGQARAERQYDYQVVASYPHDPYAFSQGLVYVDGYLLEGTGLYGQSSLRQVRLADGVVVRRLDLEPRFFGEGITIWENRIIQLTYREGVAFIYDLETWELIDEFSYETEGWGLTTDGKYLIMSDGSAILRYLDPMTGRKIKEITVQGQAGPVSNLNELEYIHGEIYANIWLTDQIIRIDPVTGKVLGWIDLEGLLPSHSRIPFHTDVLNGIAYDEAGDRLFVTGKNWPYLFQIRLLPRVNR
ncbi:MAG: glutaminyl-peptide cyclotransferase [Limnochordia bacterium]